MQEYIIPDDLLSQPLIEKFGVFRLMSPDIRLHVVVVLELREIFLLDEKEGVGCS